jgi:hypothetical protein
MKTSKRKADGSQEANEYVRNSDMSAADMRSELEADRRQRKADTSHEDEEKES